jgi:membrane protein DedA with SNARE-associated domain
MLAGLVSNLAWTLLILGVGVEVGNDWEKIRATFSVYQRAIYLVGGTALVLFVAFKVWQRHRRA